MASITLVLSAAPQMIVSGTPGATTWTGLTDKATADLIGDNTGLDTALNLLAPKANPTFTGTVSATYASVATLSAGTVSSEGLVDAGGFNTTGNLTASGTVTPGSKTVTELASITPSAGAQLFCTDETGGAVPVFGDGTNWRRCTDRAIVS